MVESTLHFVAFNAVINELCGNFTEDTKSRKRIIQAIEDLDARLSVEDATKEEMEPVLEVYIGMIRDMITFRFVAGRTEDPNINHIMDMIKAYSDRLTREQPMPKDLEKPYQELQDIKLKRIEIVKQRQAEHEAARKADEFKNEEAVRAMYPAETMEAESIDNI